jgi:hypothetical protein
MLAGRGVEMLDFLGYLIALMLVSMLLGFGFMLGLHLVFGTAIGVGPWLGACALVASFHVLKKMD